jgi:PKHD-type hydroxylase
MRFQIPNLLTPDELAQVQAHLANAPFIDGKLTAGWNAKQVKHNEQMPRDTAQGLQQLVEQALLRHSLFQAAARPRAIHSLLFSRYGPGMAYGRHTDNALMGGSARLRADLSFTLFLNEPEDYEGGELVTEGADDEQHYKLATNHLLVYPSTTLHRVEPVTAGLRLVAVGWVQSLIRSAERREILFDLDTARRSLFAREGKSDEFDLISKSLTNLLRSWAE